MKKGEKYFVYLQYICFFVCIVLTQYIFCRFIDIEQPFSENLEWNLITSSLLLAIPALFNRKTPIFIIFTLFTVLLYANIIHYRYYFGLIPLDSFKINSSDFVILKTSIFNGIKSDDILLFLPLIFSIIIGFVFRRILKINAKQFFQAAIVNIVLVAILLLNVIGKQKNKTENFAYDFNISAWNQQRNLLEKYGYFIYLAKEFTNKQDIILTKEDKQKIDGYLNVNNETRRNVTEKPIAKNVILVIVESLETFPINKTVEGNEITPFLNALIADTLTYFVPHVVSQDKFGRSSDGQFIVNTGLLPVQNGVTCYLGNKYYRSLATELKSHYSTKECITLHSFTPTFWNQNSFSTMLGYDKTYGAETWDNTDAIGYVVSDSSLISQSLPKIKSAQQPFLIQLLTASSHDFIDIGHKKRFTISDVYDQRVARYLEIINYVDRCIKQIFDELQKENLLNNTVIAITGDHNIFLENKRVSVNYFRDEKLKSNQLTMQLLGDYSFIPLIVYNGTKSGMYQKIIGQIDIFPTLLDLLGIQSDWKGLGNSVFSNTPPVSAVTPQMELKGDSSALFPIQKQAWEISDLIIKGNYLKNY